MSRLAVLGAVALAACTASHQPAPDAGREPVIECDDRSGSCAATGLSGFDCCTDLETGDRYCCHSDHEIVRDDGTVVHMCGDGPACIDTYCCATAAEWYPDWYERCDDDGYHCQAVLDYPPRRDAGP